MRLAFAVATALSAVFYCAPLPAAAQDSAEMIELSLPRAARPGEAIWLEVTIGNLPPDAEIDVTAGEDMPVGTISPFGGAAARHGASYTIPLPASAVNSGRIVVRLQVLQPGIPPRPPAPGEIQSVAPIYVPISN